MCVYVCVCFASPGRTGKPLVAPEAESIIMINSVIIIKIRRKKKPIIIIINM